jgi:MtrB/PioB family decaheme-associated outer membrane protein
MRTIRLAAILTVVMAMLAVVPRAGAEIRIGGFNVEGEVETGLRYFLEEPKGGRRGKFEEYRDVPEWLFLQQLRLNIFQPDGTYSAGLEGSKWGQDDQEYSLRAGRLGLWEFRFDWDQTPHVYSTNAQFLARETSRGFYRLPEPRPSLFEHNRAETIDIEQRWDTARLSFMLTPTPELDIRVELSRINKDGEKPFSIAFGSPGGNLYEILEPVEQNIYDLRLRATYATPMWQVQGGYTFSYFDNAIRGVTADNPCFGLTGTTLGRCGGDATGAPASGLMSVAPDNMAHTWNVSGGVTLPWWRTRLSANAAYSLRFQNESFLPHTITPVGSLGESGAVTPTATRTALLALPETDLDGKVGTTLFNVNLSSRPLSWLSLKGRYRYFDYNDMSDEVLFLGHVVSDRTFVGEARAATRFDYTRHNADLDARFQVMQGLSTTVGPFWERWDRTDHREVPTSDEYGLKLALDWIPMDMVQTRLTYRPSIRRIDEYNTLSHIGHTVLHELDEAEVAATQSLLLRKFDEGERDRHRVDAMIQFFPLENLTTSFNAQWIADDYNDGRFGLRESTQWSAGADVTWQALERLAIFAGYNYENIFQQMRSRDRAPTSDNIRDDWISNIVDTVHTIHGGVNLAVIPRVLDWTFAANYQYALGKIENRNELVPVTTTAVAKHWPSIEDSLLRLETALRYHFLKNWSASLGYAWESFTSTDFRTDHLTPFIPPITGTGVAGTGVTSIFLGSDQKDYDAHIIGVSLRYAFR